MPPRFVGMPFTSGPAAGGFPSARTAAYLSGYGNGMGSLVGRMLAANAGGNDYRGVDMARRANTLDRWDDFADRQATIQREAAQREEAFYDQAAHNEARWRHEDALERLRQQGRTPPRDPIEEHLAKKKIDEEFAARKPPTPPSVEAQKYAEEQAAQAAESIARTMPIFSAMPPGNRPSFSKEGKAEERAIRTERRAGETQARADETARRAEEAAERAAATAAREAARFRAAGLPRAFETSDPDTRAAQFERSPVGPSLDRSGLVPEEAADPAMRAAIAAREQAIAADALAASRKDAGGDEATMRRRGERATAIATKQADDPIANPETFDQTPEEKATWIRNKAAEIVRTISDVEDGAPTPVAPTPPAPPAAPAPAPQPPAPPSTEWRGGGRGSPGPGGIPLAAAGRGPTYVGMMQQGASASGGTNPALGDDLAEIEAAMGAPGPRLQLVGQPMYGPAAAEAAGFFNPNRPRVPLQSEPTPEEYAGHRGAVRQYLTGADMGDDLAALGPVVPSAQPPRRDSNRGAVEKSMATPDPATTEPVFAPPMVRRPDGSLDTEAMARAAEAQQTIVRARGARGEGAAAAPAPFLGSKPFAESGGVRSEVAGSSFARAGMGEETLDGSEAYAVDAANPEWVTRATDLALRKLAAKTPEDRDAALREMSRDRDKFKAAGIDVDTLFARINGTGWGMWR